MYPFMTRNYLFLMITLLILAALSCSTESAPVFTLATTANPTEGGVITPNTGSFDEGEVISLQATPAEGWIFARWEQDLNTTENPMNITMNRDYNIVGVFERLRDNTTTVVDVTNPITGLTWMDRNLGASRAATSSTDVQAYGDLYQWGRAADGHQKRNSPTTNTLSSSNQPEHGSFILTPNQPHDWRSPQNNNLWKDENGTNNPCPNGYRLPTSPEWEAERQSWSSNDANGAYNSVLKLPMSGFRDRNSGDIGYVGSYGGYWSGTVVGSGSYGLGFFTYTSSVAGSVRGFGLSIRCIKQ